MQWKHFGPDEATWEMVDQMQAIILPCLLVEENQFWYGVLVYVLVYVLVMLLYVHMYMDVNTAMSCVIKLQ